MSTIIQTPVKDLMQQSFIDYSMSVITDRALPDVRDGLKPVHRRILFAMHEAGNDYNKQYKKSARMVGDVIGKYHPHGDVSVYFAAVRMAQPFSMNALLIDGQGNFGSVDGDAPAAMRYTEMRLSRLSGEMFSDLRKETIAWRPNYDGSENEPEVLTTPFPNLLVNGIEGRTSQQAPWSTGSVASVMQLKQAVAVSSCARSGTKRIVAAVQAPSSLMSCRIRSTRPSSWRA